MFFKKMTKKEIIKQIIDISDIHHNIRIDFNKSRKAIERAKLTDEEQKGFNEDMWIEAHCIEDFVEDFELLPMNDKGNRNLCDCRERKPKNLIKLPHDQYMSVCKEHDLWHIYQYGRMGATLYWDKYWQGNHSFSFKYYEYDLEQMQLWELEETLKEINTFNKLVSNAMIRYYDVLETQAKDYKEQCKENRKIEKYNAMVAPYEVNLFELSKNDNQSIKRNAISLIKQLKIK